MRAVSALAVGMGGGGSPPHARETDANASASSAARELGRRGTSFSGRGRHSNARPLHEVPAADAQARAFASPERATRRAKWADRPIDSVAIQFATCNASELTTQGFEADFLWQTPLDGLTFRGALAYTNAEYSKFFDVNPSVIIVEDLNGRDRERNADFAMYAGGSYEIPVFAGWMLGLATDVRYNSGYGLEGRITPWEQNSFTLVDSSLRLYSEDNRWEVSLIAKNLSDKTYAFSEGTRPGAVIGASGFQDRVTTTSIGREITLQLRARF